MPPDGLNAMQQKRASRTRKDQLLPPKRGNPGARGSDGETGVDTRYTVVPLDKLTHNPQNARTSYSEAAIDEMAASFTNFGQLQPLVVVSRSVWLSHRPEDVDQLGTAEYVVSIGNRRLAAAHNAGVTELHVRIHDELGAGGEDRFDEAMIIENSHREDLDPLLEAKALDRMTKKPGGSLRTVAKSIGRSHGYVQQRLTLLGLIPELRGVLGALDPETGETLLGFREARVLGGLDLEKQRQVWLGGPPFAPPAQDSATASEDAAKTNTDARGVNRVSTSSTRRRVMLPTGDPSKLASMLREHVPDEELVEVARILLAQADQRSDQ